MASEGNARLSARRLGFETLALVGGLVAAWATTSWLWVSVGSLIPMWLAGLTIVLVGVLVFRERLVGLAAGLVAGALICTAVFTMLSVLMSGPGAD